VTRPPATEELRVNSALRSARVPLGGKVLRLTPAERSVRAECGECHSLPDGLGLTAKTTTACRAILMDKLIKVDANVVSHGRCVANGRRCHPQDLLADISKLIAELQEASYVRHHSCGRRNSSPTGSALPRGLVETTRRFARREQPKFGPLR
jgi:hypothetical protein